MIFRKLNALPTNVASSTSQFPNSKWARNFLPILICHIRKSEFNKMRKLQNHCLQMRTWFELMVRLTKLLQRILSNKFETDTIPKLYFAAFSHVTHTHTLRLMLLCHQQNVWVNYYYICVGRVKFLFLRVNKKKVSAFLCGWPAKCKVCAFSILRQFHMLCVCVQYTKHIRLKYVTIEMRVDTNASTCNAICIRIEIKGNDIFITDFNSVSHFSQ